MFARIWGCTLCIHVLRLSDTTRIVCDPGLCRVFLVGKPRQRYFALNWWWPEYLKWCLQNWNFGETLGVASLQQLCFLSHGSQESVFCWKEVTEETLYRWNSALLIIQSCPISFFEHIVFDFITVWKASFDFILNRFVPIWPEPELSYWRWQMNGSHVIGFKKMHSRWTVEYSQDCQLYSLYWSLIGRL